MEDKQWIWTENTGSTTQETWHEAVEHHCNCAVKLPLKQLHRCLWINFYISVSDLRVSGWTLNISQLVWTSVQQICYFLHFVAVNHQNVTNRLHVISNLPPFKCKLISGCLFLLNFIANLTHQDCFQDSNWLEVGADPIQNNHLKGNEIARLWWFAIILVLNLRFNKKIKTQMAKLNNPNHRNRTIVF